MANATAITRTVTDSVMLEITPDEAQALAEVLARIGGDYTETGRRHTDSVSEALRSVGFSYTPRSQYGNDPIITGEVRFKK